MKKLFNIFCIAFFAFVSAVASNESKNTTQPFPLFERVEMPSFDASEMLREDSINEQQGRIGGMRFAKKFFVNLTPENSGTTATLPDGRRVWTVGIVSRGAFSINLFFDKFQLKEGDTLFVYNTARSQIYSFTAKNNLKSGVLPIPPLNGDEIVVEFRQSILRSAAAQSLQIGEVNHGYRGFQAMPGDLASENKDNCSLYASCVPEVAEVKQSVCLLIINGNEFCSGSLVNNTAQDGKPYILTAAHCFGNEYSSEEDKILMAPSVVAFFNYEIPDCNLSKPAPTDFFISGSVMRALASDIDMALVELSTVPPADFRPYYAGWNLNTVSLPPPFRGIHHPYSVDKRVAVRNGNISRYPGTPITGMQADSHWLVASWDIGTTQPGSSGSPLFDADMRVVGALTGGRSQCDNSLSDFYYRFNKAWDYYSQTEKQLKAWLDPLNANIGFCNGFNPLASDANPPRTTKTVVFPNPTNGELRIENGELEMGNIELFDLSGSRIYNLQVKNHTTQLRADISHLPQGIYLLKITHTNGSETHKIIVDKK
ncbi:MAG: T9SS type A sorting domain-containing protein [Prevotellaceae bacterium]|jgi:hypothetical protein|nr:T9SS type A sorting domain-containing protein [Prevotellaceae bacterium]